jgi:putative transposase
MARLARLVIPGLPHHVTQRGNRRQPTFFNDGDYAAYLELMGEWCRENGVEIWSYCLMPNHAHLIAVPSSEDGLRWAIGEAHRRYTRRINFREKWRGYLWQGRFASFVMDEPHLLAAARYVELNPVRAQLVAYAGDWRWSSARAHLSGRDDGLVKVSPVGDDGDGTPFWTVPYRKRNSGKCGGMAAPAGRSETRRSLSVWKALSGAS